MHGEREQQMATGRSLENEAWTTPLLYLVLRQSDPEAHLRQKTGVKIGRRVGGLLPWKINWTERGIPWAGRAWALEDCSEHHGLTAAVSVSAQPIGAQQTAIQGRNTRRRLSQWVPTSVRVYGATGNAFTKHKTICWHQVWVLAEINQWSH